MSTHNPSLVAELIKAGKLTIGDGYRAKNNELAKEGIPFARAGNISGGFQFEDADYFPLLSLNKVGGKVSQPGDIVFTSKGTVGRFAFVREDTQRFVYSPQLCYWRSTDQSSLNARFLFYWMNGREFLEQMDAVKGQTDMADYVNLADQRCMKITLPAIEVQKSIAAVLGSLDDKIDLLHQQNRTLEQLAQTVFRQWFVEEEDAISLKPVSEFVTHLKAGVSPHKEPTTMFRHYSLPAFDEGREPKLEVGKSILSNKYRVFPYTLLVSKLNPRTPRIWMIPEDADVANSICSTEFQVLKPFRQEDLGFLFCFLNSDVATQTLAGAAGGTSGSHQRVNPEDILSLELPYPSEKRRDRFDNLTAPFWKKTSHNKKQIQTLTELRDTLLQKLMSGEVRVNI